MATKSTPRYLDFYKNPVHIIDKIYPNLGAIRPCEHSAYITNIVTEF